jgi:hypothetical protein
MRAFQRPDTLVEVDVDPWTGLRPQAGGPSVRELFIGGTEPTASVGSPNGVCGIAILSVAGYESQHENWMAADRDWIARARRGP